MCININNHIVKTTDVSDGHGHGGSFNLCQRFENQVVKVSLKGWHSLKYLCKHGNCLCKHRNPLYKQENNYMSN